jgi:hypothetical protein
MLNKYSMGFMSFKKAKTQVYHVKHFNKSNFSISSNMFSTAPNNHIN